MASYEEAVSIIKANLATKEGKIQWQIGYMGDGAGNVNTARENYKLVRYPFEDSPAVPVFCTAPDVAIVDGLRVKVGYLPWEPGLFQVITSSDQRFNLNDASTGDTVETPTGNNGAGYVNLAAHAINHQYLNIDPVYINWRQITPLGVFPVSPASLSVQIFGGYIPRPGEDIYIPDQTIDLTSHVPGSGARYVLISYDSTGAVIATDGAINAGGFGALTTADIPDTPAGNWRSCGVVLYAGQTAIVETRAERDFFDLRFPEESLAGSITPDQILLTNTHVIVGDAGGLGADVALSGDATIANTGALTLATVNANVGTFGDDANVPQITVNAKGLVTAAVNVPINVFTPINIYNETQTADGTSTTYYLLNFAAASTIRVYINGIRQPASDDVSATDEVIFTTAPDAGALLLFDYELEQV